MSQRDVPKELSRVDGCLSEVSKPCQSALFHHWSSHSQCPKLRALVLRWHTMISDLKAEYHGANDPLPTGLG